MKENYDIMGLDFSRKEIEKARDNERLLSLTFELSKDCNLDCVYCHKEKTEEKTLNLEEIYDIIDQAAYFAVKHDAIIAIMTNITTILCVLGMLCGYDIFIHFQYF